MTWLLDHVAGLLPGGGVLSFLLGHWELLTGAAGLAVGAIPFVGPALAFIGSNWRWLVPVAVCAGSLAFGLVERSNYEEEKAARAGDQAAALKAIEAKQREADRVSSDLLIEQATAMAADAKKETVYVDRIIAAPVTPEDEACARSPLMRDASDSVRDVVTGADKPASRLRAAPAVRGSGARP